MELIIYVPTRQNTMRSSLYFVKVRSSEEWSELEGFPARWGDKALGDIPVSSVSCKSEEGCRHQSRQNAKAIKTSRLSLKAEAGLT